MPEGPPKIDLTSIPEQLRPFFEAKENGTLKEYYAGKFRHLRDDYRDDLPAEDVRSLTKLDEKGHFVGDNYKCRGNYMFILSNVLAGAIENGVIADPEVLKKIEEFQHHDFRFRHDERTTPEEIELINRTLKAVIAYLET